MNVYDNLTENDTIVIAGKTMTVREANSGFMAQADYSRKTAELAEQRKALQAELTQYKEQATQFENFKNALHESPLDVIRGLQEQFKIAPETPKVPENDSPDRIATPTTTPDNIVLNEIKELQRQISMMKAESDLGSTFSKIKEAHGDVDKAALFAFAAKSGITDLELAYKAMAFDGLKENSMKTAEQNQKAQLDAMLASYTADTFSSLPTASSGGSIPETQFDNTDDAIRAAITQIGLPS